MPAYLLGLGPSAPVPVIQREDEFSQLLDLYRERKPKSVLEIGTYHGGTLYHWLQNAEPGTTVVSVDSYLTEVDNRHLYGEWVPEGVELHVVEGNSFDQRTKNKVLEINPVYEWVFIDAGHLYEEVKSDWLNYGGLCVKGGIVAFHDILNADVARLWDEIAFGYETSEFVGDSTLEWHGIGVVFR